MAENVEAGTGSANSALRKADQLRPDEIRAARLAIAELIANRSPDLANSLKERRKELATRLHCSTGTINSVTAYVRYWATQALQDTGPTALSSDDVVTAWYYLEQSPPAAVGDVLRQMGASEKRVDDTKLIQVVEAYRRKVNANVTRQDKGKSTRAPKAPHVPAEKPTDTGVLETPIVADVAAPQVEPITVPNDEVDEVTGSTYNYDNPEKNEWRDGILMDRVCEKIPEQSRPEAKVLCLGGRRNLEPKAYIAHNFRPGNITSAEKIKKVWGEFQETGAQLGIHTHCGDVQSVRSRERFRVVSLDYTGPPDSAKEADTMTIVLADDAEVILNFQMKRDRPATRASALMLQAGAERIEEVCLTGLKRGYPINAQTTEEREAEYKRVTTTKLSPLEWDEARKRLAVQILMSFGTERTDNYMLQGFPLIEGMFRYNYKYDPNADHDKESKKMLSLQKRLDEQYMQAMQRRTKVSMPPLGGMGANFIAALEACYACRSFIREVKFEKYQSKHKGASNPFLTVCASMHTPRTHYRKHLGTYRALARILEAMSNDASEEGSLSIRNEAVVKNVLGMHVEKSDVILSYNQGDQCLGKVPMFALLEATNEYVGIVGQHYSRLYFPETGLPLDKNAFLASQSGVINGYKEQVLKKKKRAINRARSPKYRNH